MGVPRSSRGGCREQGDLVIHGEVPAGCPVLRQECGKPWWGFMTARRQPELLAREGVLGCCALGVQVGKAWHGGEQKEAGPAGWQRGGLDWASEGHRLGSLDSQAKHCAPDPVREGWEALLERNRPGAEGSKEASVGTVTRSQCGNHVSGAERQSLHLTGSSPILPVLSVPYLSP